MTCSQGLEGRNGRLGMFRIDDELTFASGLMGLETRKFGGTVEGTASGRSGQNSVALVCVSVDTERRRYVRVRDVRS